MVGGVDTVAGIGCLVGGVDTVAGICDGDWGVLASVILRCLAG